MSTRINAVHNIVLLAFIASILIALTLTLPGGEQTFNVGDGMGWKVSPSPTTAP